MIFKMESFSENKIEAIIDSSQQWWSVIWMKLCMQGFQYGIDKKKII